MTQAISSRVSNAHFADQIRRARLAAKFSQAAAAKRVGISRSMISRYESGESTPDASTLAALCLLYKVSADRVLFATNENRPARLEPNADLRRTIGLIANLPPVERAKVIALIDQIIGLIKG